jgi:ABC-2 type transport system ATP-binding protein
MEDIMLKLQNLSKSYQKGKIKAVDSLNISVSNGEIFGFLGPNGAGKTTTLKMIVGLLEPDEGNVIINGINMRNNPIETKKQFSYVPDNPEVFKKLRGIDYLNFLGDVYEIPTDTREKRIETYARRFEMSKSLQDSVDSYSHGMQQKIILIGALLHEPSIFILDEPMVGLDPKSSFELKQIMREHCDKGNSVLFSTHVLEVAEKVCDRIAIIKEGHIIATGSMEEIRNQSGSEESLEQIFLELTE